LALSDFRFRHRIRVRYGEGDQQGVVFNARYLDYGDIAVTEYWRAVGFRFVGENVLEFHVARAEVDYKKPIKPDELIDLWARTERIGNSSLAVLVEIHGSRDDGAEDLRATIREVQVNVDLESHKSVPLPDHVKAKFREFDQRPDPVLTP
jgi:acyl-CoA thioester hydrolase